MSSVSMLWGGVILSDDLTSFVTKKINIFKISLLRFL